MTCATDSATPRTRPSVSRRPWPMLLSAWASSSSSRVLEPSTRLERSASDSRRAITRIERTGRIRSNRDSTTTRAR